MHLATSTCLFPGHRQGGRTPILESIQLCADAGFRHIDLNFGGAGGLSRNTELARDDWEAWVDEVGELAARLGVSFTQSHLPFDSNLYRNDVKPPLSDEYRTWFREATRRAILTSGRLGVKWMVAHGQTATIEDEMNLDANIRANLDFFGWQLELAKSLGSGIALENMAEFNHAKTKRRFTALVEEQIAVIDTINDPAFGGAWDFGHAELVYRDQIPPLRKLGHRLKATHVQENDKAHDNHYIPFVRGTTPWEQIMPLLKEIGYEGDFTYEVHGFMNGVPDAMRPRAAKFAYAVGMYCMKLYDEA